MDVEFHYYITYILARKAGFGKNEAWTVAYASQYVDDNNTQYTIRDRNSPDTYQNYISQTLDITQPKNELIRIHPCFHFMPGDFVEHNNRVKRNDGLLHMLNTTPDSANASALMDTALRSGDSYRIGIATHCYADTWAHQGFVGYKHRFNDLRGLLAGVIPSIGHADALHKPDIPYLVWQDTRLVSAHRKVHNKERFLQAAENLFGKYCRLVDPGISPGEIRQRWNRLREGLDEAIGRESTRGRKRDDQIRKYGDLADDMEIYDKDTWLEDAVEKKRRPRVVDSRSGKRRESGVAYYKKEGFQDSHWHQFQEAAKAHQEAALAILMPILEEIEFTRMRSY